MVLKFPLPIAKKLKKKTLVVLVLYLMINSVYSQIHTDTLFKNISSGIDVVNFLTFLQKKPESCLFNFRYEIKKNKTLRLGINLDLSNGTSSGYYPDIRMGIQKNRKSENWNLFYGIDASYSYFKSTANPTTQNKIGLSPLLGVEYYFNKHLSLVTEETINFSQYFDYNPNSFDAHKRNDYFRITTGSVGMFLLMYHF